MAGTHQDTSGHAASATPTAPAANKATLAIVGKVSRNQRCLTCPKMKCFRGCSGSCDSLCVQTGMVSLERIEDTRSMHLQGHREGRPQNAQGVCNSGSEALRPLFKPLQALAGLRETSDDSSTGVGELARIPGQWCESNTSRRGHKPRSLLWLISALFRQSQKLSTLTWC